MTKKVCIVHYSSAPGGIELLMPGIIRGLPDHEFSVFVIRPPAGGEINVYKDSQVKITYGSANNFTAALRLWRFIVKNRPSIFHGFNTGPFFMLIVRLACIETAVYSVRGTLHYNSSFQKIYRRAVWRMAISRSYRLIANSEYSRRKYLEFTGLPEEQISVLYNPVGSSRLEFSQVRKPGKPFTVIYVGRLTEGKNLFRWIDVAVAVHKEKTESSFILYGDGPLRVKLESYACNLSADEFITFRGHVENIPEAYHQADLLLFLSEYESFGNVVVESILCGTPVIASDIPSMREIFNQYPQFLVSLDKNLEESIIGKIKAADQLSKLLPEVSAEFRKRFSTEHHLKGLSRIYNSFA